VKTVVIGLLVLIAPSISTGDDPANAPALQQQMSGKKEQPLDERAQEMMKAIRQSDRHRREFREAQRTLLLLEEKLRNFDKPRVNDARSQGKEVESGRWAKTTETRSDGPKVDGVRFWLASGLLHVSDVAPGSLAAKSGLRAKDILLNVNGMDITSADDVARALASNKKAAGADIRVWRAAEILTLQIPLGRYP